MAIKSNPLIYVVAGITVTTMGVLLFSGPEDNLVPATPLETVVLDDTDTPSEEVRAVGSQLEAIQSTIEQVTKNQDTLVERLANIERRADILETVPATAPGDHPAAPEDSGVGFPQAIPGLGEAIESPFGPAPGADESGAPAPGVQIRWIAPAARLPADAGIEDVRFAGGLPTTEIRAALTKTARGTVPPGAMIDAWTLTALVGRVPVRGQVADAWPFKVVSGRGIASNWTSLNLDGLIWEGVAYGDYTLRCVRGQLRRVTAIFADGRVATFEGRQNATDSLTTGLGWLTDESGRPCLTGELITDAPRQIGRQALVGTFVGLARAVAENERTRTVNADGVETSTLSGDATRAAVGDALSQSAQNVQAYLAERQGDIWDAIYTPPNQAVTIHVSQEINFESENDKTIFSAATAADYGSVDLD